jgi:hypothetical protein
VGCDLLFAQIGEHKRVAALDEQIQEAKKTAMRDSDEPSIGEGRRVETERRERQGQLCDSLEAAARRRNVRK